MRDPRREQQGHPYQQSQARIELTEVEPQSGIDKREATASNYYPEEWPKEFICHGAIGFMLRVLVRLYQDRSWVVIKFCLLVNETNMWAQGFYRKCGFNSRFQGETIFLPQEGANAELSNCS